MGRVKEEKDKVMIDDSFEAPKMMEVPKRGMETQVEMPQAKV